MKILLIMCDANMHKFRVFGRLKSAREAPLTLTTLAAIGCQDPEIEFRLVDESIDPVPLDYPADLVGISVLTGTSRRAYALANHFRSRGITVVLGGIHVSILPDEAARYADAIVIGMAEQAWPQLLRDFKAGKMAPVYREKPADGDYAYGIPTPRYDLQRKSGYVMPYTVMVTRGCTHKCDFCTVPVVWNRYLRRPIADVVRDVKAIPSRRFAINDVSPFEDADYAKELLRALIPLKKKWGALATTRIASDPELLDLLVPSGCQYLLLGFESISQRSLNRIYKGFNSQEDYGEVMRRLHEARIVVQGCFVFGFDEDDKEIFAATVDEVQRLKVDIPRYSLYTPYPGTVLFQRFQQEQRILTYDWGFYDTMHVVIQPKLMTPVELYEGFRWAYRETFRWKNILRRSVGSGTRLPIVLVGNIVYRKFTHKIDMLKGFELPPSVSEISVSATCPICEAPQKSPTNQARRPVPRA